MSDFSFRSTRAGEPLDFSANRADEIQREYRLLERIADNLRNPPRPMWQHQIAATLADGRPHGLRELLSNPYAQREWVMAYVSARGGWWNPKTEQVWIGADLGHDGDE